jgi:hypothetical protein
MKNLLKCSSLIRVGVIMVVMAFMASQVTGTYAGATKGGGKGDPHQACCKDAWSKLLTTDRFELVMNGEAVLDHETCLVWEQSPDTTVITWTEALDHCFNKKVGGRKGWRAPTIEELATLVDDTQGPPTLPSGHPFDTNAVQSSFYWSSTTDAAVTFGAWVVNFSNGNVERGGFDKVTPSARVWCVRGGQGHDAPVPAP